MTKVVPFFYFSISNLKTKGVGEKYLKKNVEKNLIKLGFYMN